MKITAVKTAATRGLGMHLWVRVETDEGITGTGECVHGGVQAIALIHELRPKLIGRDPFEIDAIFEDLRRRHVIDVDIGAYTGDYRRGGGVQKDRFNYTADPWEHERMLKIVEMVVAAAGPNIDVDGDVHTRLDVTSAIRQAKELEQLHMH